MLATKTVTVKLCRPGPPQENDMESVSLKPRRKAKLRLNLSRLFILQRVPEIHESQEIGRICVYGIRRTKRIQRMLVTSSIILPAMSQFCPEGGPLRVAGQVVRFVRVSM